MLHMGSDDRGRRNSAIGVEALRPSLRGRPGLIQAAFPPRIPTPNPAAENLRRLAIRYLQHPDAQVGMVNMEAGAAGRFKVVIVLESHDIF